MYSQLDDVLCFQDCLPTGNIFVMDELNCDGSFMLQHFVTSCLKANGNVLLINNLQGFNHYHQICLKSGVNLKVLKEKKKVVVLDLLENTYNQICENGFANSPANLIDENLLKRLYIQIRDVVKSFNENEENVLVVIDNLTAFLNLGISLRDLTNFARYCCQAVNSKMPQLKNCFLMRATVSHEDSDDELAKLLRFINLTVDLNVTVSSLRTGFSNDICGNIEIRKDNAEDRVYQYNFQNLRLILYPYGTASSIL